MAVGEDGAGCELLISSGVMAALILQLQGRGLSLKCPGTALSHVWVTLWGALSKHSQNSHPHIKMCPRQ